MVTLVRTRARLVHKETPRLTLPAVLVSSNHAASHGVHDRTSRTRQSSSPKSEERSSARDSDPLLPLDRGVDRARGKTGIFSSDPWTADRPARIHVEPRLVVHPCFFPSARGDFLFRSPRDPERVQSESESERARERERERKGERKRERERAGRGWRAKAEREEVEELAKEFPSFVRSDPIRSGTRVDEIDSVVAKVSRVPVPVSDR